MRVNALVVDLALLGREAWDFLEQLADGDARPGHGGLHRPLHRGPARSRAAAGRRRLGHQAVPSRGGPRAGGGGRPPAQAGRRPRRRGPGRRRRPRDPRRPVPGLRRRPQRGPHPARVRGAPAAGPRRGQGAPARGDLPAGVGLRDGPRRPFGGRLHPQGAPEARGGLARRGSTSTPTSAWATASTRSCATTAAIAPDRSREPSSRRGGLRSARGRARHRARRRPAAGAASPSSGGRVGPCASRATDASLATLDRAPARRRGRPGHAHRSTD